jgi:4-amino-4-deoxy-L-arabinose transferase-like glycosyltransferase
MNTPFSNDSCSPPFALPGWRHLTAVAFIFLFGVLMRFHVWHDFDYVGFDEKIYCGYVSALDSVGPSGFSKIARSYIVDVQEAAYVYLPPTRVAYLFPAYALHNLLHLPVLVSLRVVSAISSCLFMLAAYVFALRWMNPRNALAALALLACAPLQIHMAQYAFIDGVAALAALLSVACFWESLQRGGKWIAAFAASFLFLLLTKQETAVFVGLFFGVMLLCVGRMGFGRAGWCHAFAVAASVVAAVGILSLLSGGPGTLREVFQVYTRLSMTLPYTLATGGGPWYRYLVENVVVNPAVFLLAAGFGICLAAKTPLNRYLLVFFVLTYAVMCSIPHGMNLRHTVMWDFPVVLFAVQCVDWIVAGARARGLVFSVVIGILCLLSLRQYESIFVTLYDTDPTFMFRKAELTR